jgi:AcrR family transcriptional regulator
VGVAKGLFYYYFKSREELLAAIVDRILAEMEQIVIEAVDQKGLTAMERLNAMSPPADTIKARGGNLMQYFHEERNQALHLQFQARTMKFLVPALESIIRQGGGGKGIQHSIPPGNGHCLVRREERHRPLREGN